MFSMRNPWHTAPGVRMVAGAVLGSRAVGVAVFLAAWIAVTAGCALSGLGGARFPAQQPGESYPGVRRALDGIAERAANGCLFVTVDGTRSLAIWPAGSTYGEVVNLPGGAVLAQGATFTATGALTPAAPLVGNGANAWAAAITFCVPNPVTLLVLDDVRPAP